MIPPRSTDEAQIPQTNLLLRSLFWNSDGHRLPKSSHRAGVQTACFLSHLIHPNHLEAVYRMLCLLGLRAAWWKDTVSMTLVKVHLLQGLLKHDRLALIPTIKCPAVGRAHPNQAILRAPVKIALNLYFRTPLVIPHSPPPALVQASPLQATTTSSSPRSCHLLHPQTIPHPLLLETAHIPNNQLISLRQTQ